MDNKHKNQQMIPHLKSFDMESYYKAQFFHDRDKFQEFMNLKTGYANLDKITNLHKGLYILGAIPSLGKTTFIHQMAEQFAAQEQPVLYFSLEQTAFELSIKSLTRAWYRRHGKKIDNILNCSELNEVIEDSKTFSKNLTIIECDFSITLRDIENYIKSFIANTGVTPIVIIDYLQVLNCSSKSSAKESVDENVSYLKQMQKEHSLVLVVISSLNRQNYLIPVDMESFKESGGIEYMADVLWGLQLQILNDPKFLSIKDIAEKRKMIREEKVKIPRRLELVCLKNRFGNSTYQCAFTYYQNMDLFMSCED